MATLHEITANTITHHKFPSLSPALSRDGKDPKFLKPEPTEEVVVVQVELSALEGYGGT